jgi:hypothetical protein
MFGPATIDPTKYDVRIVDVSGVPMTNGVFTVATPKPGPVIIITNALPATQSIPFPNFNATPAPGSTLPNLSPVVSAIVSNMTPQQLQAFNAGVSAYLAGTNVPNAAALGNLVKP